MERAWVKFAFRDEVGEKELTNGQVLLDLGEGVHV